MGPHFLAEEYLQVVGLPQSTLWNESPDVGGLDLQYNRLGRDRNERRD
jgi:hypothetical protein